MRPISKCLGTWVTSLRAHSLTVQYGQLELKLEVVANGKQVLGIVLTVMIKAQMAVKRESSSTDVRAIATWIPCASHSDVAGEAANALNQKKELHCSKLPKLCRLRCTIFQCSTRSKK